MNYTYLLECSDGTLYCGWTNDLEKRVKAHNSGRGAKYTKSRRPVRLVWYETFRDEGRGDEPGSEGKTAFPESEG